MSFRTLVQLFRFIAVAEALSWVGLVSGMYFKYMTDAGDLGVKVFGPVHGAIFIAYLALTVVVARSLSWSWRTTLGGLICSVPPFATLAFELWAQRTGRLAASTHRSGKPSSPSKVDAAK
ncbi:DUF3817 domain-containing protein [Nocardioides caldifontis]|uniref:DUF3817 domain-containing protein n=1 Tax=Nocardioides caldifontis TaxID=2588938 RepID=UPI0011E06D3E|nr:DUF3817 domain-containing protein [Nocardioides caldifontis]